MPWLGWVGPSQQGVGRIHMNKMAFAVQSCKAWKTRRENEAGSHPFLLDGALEPRQGLEQALPHLFGCPTQIFLSIYFSLGPLGLWVSRMNIQSLLLSFLSMSVSATSYFQSFCQLCLLLTRHSFVHSFFIMSLVTAATFA